MGTLGAHLSSVDLRVTKRLLPLIPGGLVVEQVLPEPDRVTVVARSRLPTSPCPDCRAPSSRVHSRYDRRPAGLPWQGRPVAVRLRARRFFCAEPACPRRTFAERLPGVARPSARRSERRRRAAARRRPRPPAPPGGGGGGGNVARPRAPPPPPPTLALGPPPPPRPPPPRGAAAGGG